VAYSGRYKAKIECERYYKVKSRAFLRDNGMKFRAFMFSLVIIYATFLRVFRSMISIGYLAIFH
jgi:hypothetical protein